MTKTLIAGRSDGLGCRLANILYVQGLAQKRGWPSKIIWRQSLPKVHDYQGDINDVFADPTLQHIEQTTHDIETWVMENLTENDEYCDRYAPLYLNSRIGAADALIYRSLFLNLSFTSRLKLWMQRIDEWFARNNRSPWMGIHLRFGDVEKFPHIWFGLRYYPIEVYEMLFESICAKTGQIYLASNSPEIIEKYTQTLGAFSFEHIVDSTELKPIERDFLEIYILSRCQALYAPCRSAFSISASMIGGNQFFEIGDEVLGSRFKSLIQELKQQVAKDQVEAIYERGLRLADTGKPSLAMELFRMALVLDKRHTKSRRALRDISIENKITSDLKTDDTNLRGDDSADAAA
jgi:hypothetical protein